MKIKLTIAALALAVAPTLAHAEGCAYGHIKQTAQECAPGQVMDSKTGSCVNVAQS